MTKVLRGVLAAALVIVAVAWPAVAQQGFSSAPLTIETGDGGRHDFTVELAVSPSEQSQGLMFRQSMPADAGMLFPYTRDAMRSFWMRNTLVPLDILFIGGDGRIAHIVQRTVPLSEATISSRVPVRAVLEVNAGTVRRLGIAVGDRVLSDELSLD